MILSDLGNFTYSLVDMTSYGQSSSSSGSRTLAREVSANNLFPRDSGREQKALCSGLLPVGDPRPPDV